MCILIVNTALQRLVRDDLSTWLTLRLRDLGPSTCPIQFRGPSLKGRNLRNLPDPVDSSTSASQRSHC